MREDGSTRTYRRKDSRAGFGTARCLPSGRWQASFVGPDGVRHKAPATFGTKGDAEAWLAGQRSKIADGTWTPAAPVAKHVAMIKRAETVGERLDAWAERGITKRTGKPWSPNYAMQVRKIATIGLAPLREVPLVELKPSQVRQWHARRLRDSGGSTAGKEARVLRSCLAEAVADGDIPTNPVPPELGTTKTGREFRPPTPEELGALIEAMPARLRLAVKIAAFGGLRISEWRALRRRDLTRIGDQYVINVVGRLSSSTNSGWCARPSPKQEWLR